SATATATATPGVELLSNTGFDELNAENKPVTAPWTLGATNVGDKVKCNKAGKPEVALSGTCAFRFKGSVGEASSVTQPVSSITTISTGDTLTLSFFANAEAAPVAKAKLRVKYSDTTPKGKVNIDLTITTGYTPFSQSYTVVGDAIASVKVKFSNSSTAGKFYIDDVSLLLVEGAAATATPTSTAAPRLNTQG
ncbi:MAG: hypothetical protein H7Y11_10355, partial [Armatimonadetes bacterium]|nr:hypothetical protein [Anaerolineae bacterium]